MATSSFFMKLLMVCGVICPDSTYAYNQRDRVRIYYEWLVQTAELMGLHAELTATAQKKLIC